MELASESVPPVGDVGRLLRQTLDIEGRLERNPYGMVAGALGIGFVLGGGLFTRLSARIFGVGLRVALMAALPVLERQIRQVVSGSKLNKRRENGQ